VAKYCRSHFNFSTLTLLSQSVVNDVNPSINQRSNVASTWQLISNTLWTVHEMLRPRCPQCPWRLQYKSRTIPGPTVWSPLSVLSTGKTQNADYLLLIGFLLDYLITWNLELPVFGKRTTISIFSNDFNGYIYNHNS